MSNSSSRPADGADGAGSHLDGLPDGAGCSEIWDHLSEVRGRAADD